MNKLQLFALACCTALSGCVGIPGFARSPWTNNVHKGVVLAKVSDKDGTQRTWRVYPGNNTRPRIELAGRATETHPKIGVHASSVTRKRAQSVGTTPFRGIWIEKVIADKAADHAGITAGEIVLEVNGKEVHHHGQFNDLIASIGVPGEPLILTVLNKRQQGDPIDSETTSKVSVTPYAAKTVRGTTDSIPLAYSKGVQSYTGMQVATVESELANTIFGSLQEITLITGVVPGSPAYNAGLRAGDRILKLDGQANPALQDVRNSVLDRVRTSSPTAPLFDLARDRPMPISTDDNHESMQLLVDGPLGPHDASISIEAVGDHTRFYVPIIVGYENSVHSSRVSFLNFIFQFGFNYSSNMHASETRDPVETSKLSILPLGMFGVRHELHRSQYTLFWFIRWSTENHDNTDAIKGVDDYE